MFAPTNIGKEIGRESGLDDLAQKLHDDYDDASIVGGLREYGSSWMIGEQIDAITDNAHDVGDHLRSKKEIQSYREGLAIDGSYPSWRYLSGSGDEGALFDVEQFADLASATPDVDRLVLSGFAGLDLKRRHVVRALFSSTGLEQFGFEDRIQAARFVGGYLLGAMKELDEQRFRRVIPGYTYNDGFVETSIACPIDLHGDFRISQTQRATETVLSPIGTREHFGPEKNMVVSGYHSIEPHLVEHVLEDVYLRSGETGLLEFIDEATQVIIETFADESGEIPFRSGPFGDYGGDGRGPDLFRLRLITSDDDYRNRVEAKDDLAGYPVLPNSKDTLGLRREDKGLLICNRHPGYEDVGFLIPTEHYSLFFCLLIQQGQFGAGRTSPQQIIETLEAARTIMKGDD